MYGLSLANAANPDKSIVEALVRSGKFLKENYISANTSEAGTMHLVRSRASTSGTNAAVLGATGLGLVGLCGLEQAQPGSTPLEDLQAMGRFLLFLQKEDGSFYSKYRADEDEKSDTFSSLYFPGEAALGLILLYKLDPSPHWIEGAEKALAYLAKSRESERDIPPDHWALIATQELLSLPDRTEGTPLPREALMRHSIQICESMLSDQITNAKETDLNGGFDPEGRTTPTSTRLEGLLAALRFLPPEQKDLRTRTEKAVSKGVQFLLTAQIRSGPCTGGVPRAITRTQPTVDNEEASSASSRDSEVRIDYVQHFLSALLRYQGQVLKQ